MKIDSNRPNFDTSPVGQADATKASDVKSAGASATSRGADQVSVSPAAQFASSAIAAASSAPDVRPDVVERAKALLADGKIGDDPHRLADAMIDRALESND
jgi:flagellar biosynthesis anti-sigma factor FlgM